MSIASTRRSLKQRIREKEKDLGNFDFYSYEEGLLFYADMAKNAVDTFSPYKRSAQRYRDLFQLGYGIKNLFLGILYFIPAIILPLGDLMYETIPSLLTPSSFFPKLRDNLYALGGNLFGAFSQSLRGLTQIITSPFSLLRVTWRSLLSTNTSDQKFQERKSIRRLVSEADALLEKSEPGSIGKMRIVLNELDRKAVSNITKKQKLVGPSIIPTAYQYHTSFPPLAIRTTTFINNSVNDNEQVSEKTIKDYKLFTSYLAAFRLPENQLDGILRKYKTSKDQSTPDVHLALRRAAHDGNREDVIYLLDIGKADPTLTSNNGKTALMWASAAGHEDVVELLQERNNLSPSAP